MIFSRPRERICGKRSNWGTTVRTLSVRVARSILCSKRLNKLPAAIQPIWFWARPELAKGWSLGQLTA